MVALLRYRRIPYKLILGSRELEGLPAQGQGRLATFPTPMAITAVRARRVFAWTGIVEDLTGLEPTEDDWFDLTELPATLKALLGEVGRV